MHRKIYITILFISFFVTSHLSAQYSHNYEIDKYKTTTDRFGCPNEYDIENTLLYQIRHHTSLVDWFFKTKGFNAPFNNRIKKDQNILKFSVDNLENRGAYLFYDGSGRTESEIMADGIIRLMNAGTLLGQATYKRRCINSIRYNYATYPEDYVPYLVGDSISEASTNQEIYNVKGGYSFSFGKWNYGFDALYEGIAQSRVSNPRYSNYSYWLRLGLSTSRIFRKDVLGIRISPELNSQSISVSTLLNSVKYFQLYGLGQWNRRESNSGSQYGRIQQIHGLCGEIMHLHSGKWKLFTELIYSYRSLSTEETSLKNLFLSSTHHIQQMITASRYYKKSSLHLQLVTQQHIRRGLENVYENILQDPTQKLYDYVLVGNNQFYFNSNYGGDLRGKFICNLPSNSFIHLTAGLSYMKFEETYQVPHSLVMYSNLTPLFIIGIQRSKENHSLECNLKTSIRRNLNKKHIVSLHNNSVLPELIQTPFLLQTQERYLLGAQLIYSYLLPTFNEIGMTVNFDHINSRYRKKYQFGVELFYAF